MNPNVASDVEFFFWPHERLCNHFPMFSAVLKFLQYFVVPLAHAYRIRNFLLPVLLFAIMNPTNAKAGREPAYVGPYYRWIVIASRPNYDEAVSVASRFVKSFPYTTIVHSRNGWYAVVLDAVVADEAASFKNNLIYTEAIPEDSFLSEGRYFEFVEWTALDSDHGGTAQNQAICEKFRYLCE